MKDNYYSHLANQSKFNTKNFKGPVVLLSPLDWGLGHATRCIPIVNHLLRVGCEVIIAVEGPQKDLLEQEFPLIQFVDIKGYRLRFGKERWSTIVKILSSVPKILTAINQEKKWLNAFLKANKVDLIISDNRYGFTHAEVPSVFITHQLTIRSPFGKLSQRVLQKMNYHFIDKFDMCWVPDYQEFPGLAATLSHPQIKPSIPVRYLGPLSRFDRNPESSLSNDVLVILSGPEPQRTILEEKILTQLSQVSKKVIVVRGLPGDTKTKPTPENGVLFYNHLPKAELNQLVLASSVIISRSGYSTIMDLLPLGKRCIFIPTPGQTEQEYLARNLTEQGYCLSFSQEAFSLPKALEIMKDAVFKKLSVSKIAFEEIIDESLKVLLKKSAV